MEKNNTVSVLGDNLRCRECGRTFKSAPNYDDLFKGDCPACGSDDTELIDDFE